MATKIEIIMDLLSGKTLTETRSALRDLQFERQRTEEATRQLRSLMSSGDAAQIGNMLSEILKNGVTAQVGKLAFTGGDGPQHMMTPLLLAALQADVPVLLSGDIGSGKTTATHLAASCLGLPFSCISVCPASSRSELFGYKDASGNYQSTEFRRVFGEGGVFCLDEVDNGNPQIIAGMNTALANDVCAFPDGVIPRHGMARFVAAANTTGRGASDIFSQRGILDAATLDRFAFIKFDIDESLERAIVTGDWDDRYMIDIGQGGIPNINEWYRVVRFARAACKRLGMHYAVSPRASIYGMRLMRVGVGERWLKEMLIWKGLSVDDRNKLANKMDEIGY